MIEKSTKNVESAVEEKVVPKKTRKTTAKKSTVKKETATKEVAPKKKFAETDGILCRSVTPGGLYMIGKKTGMKYEWGEYGREYEVEYRDLVIAVRTHSDFVFAPYFIIEDEDFIAEFPIVQKFYDDSYNISDLNKILNKTTKEMVKAITALPPGAKNSFKSIASTKVNDGELDSIEKIKAIDEIFGTNLLLLVNMK